MEGSPEPKPIDPADLAWRDDLTGAWNRRYLRRLLEVDWPQLVAEQGTITLLLLDLDFFKEINDAHGHPAGDQVLVWAANQLRKGFRAEDRLIRYGGDEFVVALFGVSAEEAWALAERARTALETVEVPGQPGGEPVALPLSFSMGVASFPVDGASGEEILAVADRRLYEEKRVRRAAVAPADRHRPRLLIAVAVALVVLVGSAWIGWRRLRLPPPPPTDISQPEAGDAAPPTEIVVRDEAELERLREDVRRLQKELAEPRPAGDRERYEARIRDLEARLTEAGDDREAAVRPPGAGSDARAANDAGTVLQIGERRARESLELLPLPLVTAKDSAPAAAPEPAASATTAAPRIELPQLLRAVRPAYPRVAREARKVATVQLKVRVDTAGKVVSTAPVGLPAGFGFDEAARQAAASAQFRPGRRDGVAVEMDYWLAIRFVLEGPPG